MRIARPKINSHIVPTFLYFTCANIPSCVMSCRTQRGNSKRWFSTHLLISATLLIHYAISVNQDYRASDSPGYGSVAPRTALGKVITIVYALIGIPLMLVYLSTIGDVLARNFRRLYGRLCGSSSTKNSSSGLGKSGKMGPGVSASSTAAISSSAESYLSGYAASTKSHNSISADGSAIKLYPDHHPPGEDKLVVLDCGGDGIGSGADPGGGKQQQQHHHRQHCEASPSPVRVPISLCLLIILLYICGGALLFNRLENWTFLEGSYFCFTSLGTIGFGDLIPGLYHQAGEQLSVFASSAYILVGMALIAMCFNLVQDQVVIGVRRMGRYFGVTGRAVGGDGDDEDMMMDVVDGEGIAMSVVSSSATSS